MESLTNTHRDSHSLTHSLVSLSLPQGEQTLTMPFPFVHSSKGARADSRQEHDLTGFNLPVVVGVPLVPRPLWVPANIRPHFKSTTTTTTIQTPQTSGCHQQDSAVSSYYLRVSLRSCFSPEHQRTLPSLSALELVDWTGPIRLGSDSESFHLGKG